MAGPENPNWEKGLKVYPRPWQIRAIGDLHHSAPAEHALGLSGQKRVCLWSGGKNAKSILSVCLCGQRRQSMLRSNRRSGRSSLPVSHSVVSSRWECCSRASSRVRRRPSCHNGSVAVSGCLRRRVAAHGLDPISGSDDDWPSPGAQVGLFTRPRSGCEMLHRYPTHSVMFTDHAAAGLHQSNAAAATSRDVG